MNRDILDLQEMLKLARQANKNTDDLLQRRERLEEKILRLKSAAISPYDALDTREMNHKNKDEIGLLKQEKQKIDNMLDIAEGLSQRDIDKMEERLIRLILENYPNETPVYDNFAAKLQSLEDTDREARFLMEQFQPLAALLRSAVNNKNPRRIHVINTLLGRSPYYELSKILQAGKMLSEKLIKHLEGLIEGSVSSSRFTMVYTKLVETLQEFWIICTQRWGFQKREYIFQNSLKKIEFLMNDLEKALQDNKREKAQVDDEFHVWLHRHR